LFTSYSPSLLALAIVRGLFLFDNLINMIYHHNKLINKREGVIKMWVKLISLMAERGVNGKQLAKNLSVHENTISGLRSGKRKPSMKMIEKLAEALNVDKRELF
jgi:DNA-binding Xre family transcriptional regulator